MNAERDGLEAREARRERWRQAALVVMWTAVLVAIACVLAGLGGLIDRTGVSETVFAACLIALSLIGLAAWTAARAAAPGADHRRLAGLDGRRDREQRARTSQLLVLPAMLLVTVSIGSLNAARLMAGEREAAVWICALVVPLLVVLPPAMVMGWDGGARKLRRFLEDELTREFRARAMALGFWVLLGSATTLYLVGLWRPAEAVALLPFALWAGGGAAALKFALLHRRAEREAGADG